MPTINELKAQLTEAGIPFSSKATKAELEAAAANIGLGATLPESPAHQEVIDDLVETLEETKKELEAAKAELAALKAEKAKPAAPPVPRHFRTMRLACPTGTVVLTDSEFADQKWQTASEAPGAWVMDLVGKDAPGIMSKIAPQHRREVLADGTCRLHMENLNMANQNKRNMQLQIDRDGLDCRISVTPIRTTWVRVRDAARATGLGALEANTCIGFIKPRGSTIQINVEEDSTGKPIALHIPLGA